jgi:hypothetical protein
MGIDILHSIQQQRCQVKEHLNESYVQKAVKILSSFDCFMENQIQQKKFAHHHHHQHQHPPQAYGQGYQKRYSVMHYHNNQPTIQTLHCTRTIQEIVKKSATHMSFDPLTFKMVMGCLNKMSKSNVDKLSIKLKEYLTNDNVLDFVNVICDRCAKESDYITMYLRCLQTIKTSMGSKDPIGQALSDNLQTRFDEWDVTCKPLLSRVSDDAITEYDAMIRENVLKRKVENTVRMFLIFGIHGLFEANISSLIARLYHLSIQIHTETDLVTELFLIQCKQLFLVRSKLPSSEYYEDIVLSLQSLTPKCTQRLRFLILDIIDSYHA